MKNYLLLFVLIFSISIQSCGKAIISKSAEKKISKGGYALLSEINNPETTLLVQLNGDKTYDKYMKKHMANEYSRKYDFLTVKNTRQHFTDYPSKVIHNGSSYKVFDEPKFTDKFQDSSKYRFFIGQYFNVERTTDRNKEFAMQNSTKKRCHYYILDRQTNEKLELPKSAIGYSALFQGYIRGIEAI